MTPLRVSVVTLGIGAVIGYSVGILLAVLWLFAEADMDHVPANRTREHPRRLRRP